MHQRLAAQLSRQAARRMAPIILVRHADAPWTPDENRPLSPRGVVAAHDLVERLARVDIAAIFSSPYRRAMETIVPLAASRELPVRTSVDLRERTMGDMGARSFLDVMRQTWNDFSFKLPGGESAGQVQSRIIPFVQSVSRASPEGSPLISTHGQALALLLQAFDASVGYDFWESLQFPDVFLLHVEGPDKATIERL
jgi:2,3-bisphosphoglycerate-dependent phosphoglycerate mutase